MLSIAIEYDSILAHGELPPSRRLVEGSSLRRSVRTDTNGPCYRSGSRYGSVMTWPWFRIVCSAFFCAWPIVYPVSHGDEGVGASAPDPTEISRHIEDLRSDDVRWNALRATEVLRRYGVEALAPLERALDSGDHQQRQCASSVLRDLVDALDAIPSPRLLYVTVAGLRDDACHGTFNVANANEGTDFLGRHIQRARQLLVECLRSEDRQQRFLSALLLAEHRILDDVSATCAVLIEHLEDNDIPSDACQSCAALYTLGSPAIPYLVAHENAEDVQQREAVRLILMDIRRAPVTPEDFAERASLHDLSTHLHDPCVDPGQRWLEDLGDDWHWKMLLDVERGAILIPALEDIRRVHDGEDWREAGRGSSVHPRWDHKDAQYAVIDFGLFEGRWAFRHVLRLRFHRDGRVEQQFPRHRDSQVWEPVRRP